MTEYSFNKGLEEGQQQGREDRDAELMTEFNKKDQLIAELEAEFEFLSQERDEKSAEYGNLQEN